MGNVSKKVCAAADLGSRIVKEYHSVPDSVVINGGIGFNVRGQEVGQVTDRKDGGIDILFYAPGSERLMPVFGERFG